MQAGEIRIGTSGWQYDHWRGLFYPENTSRARMLGHYVRSFDTVEVNSSFYGLPTEKTILTWLDAAPGGFLFTVKASRYVTHMKKLKEPDQGLFRFLDRVELLGERLGPILFQLPPRWRANPGRLDTFLQAFPENRRAVFEFRDPTWFSDPVLEILHKHNAGFCIYEIAGMKSPLEATADFAYVRLHGPGPQAYQGCYSQKALNQWAQTLTSFSQKGLPTFCYFDNDPSAYAAQNALELKKRLQEAKKDKGFPPAPPFPKTLGWGCWRIPKAAAFLSTPLPTKGRIGADSGSRPIYSGNRGALRGCFQKDETWPSQRRRILTKSNRDRLFKNDGMQGARKFRGMRRTWRTPQ